MVPQRPNTTESQYNKKKTTWSYDTDVHIMRVIYLAVMHERGQRECITAKYSTSMMSSVLSKLRVLGVFVSCQDE